MEAGIGAIRRAPTAGSDRSSRRDLQPFLCLRQNGPVLGLMAWHVEHGPGSSSLDSLARNFCLQAATLTRLLLNQIMELTLYLWDNGKPCSVLSRGIRSGWNFRTICPAAARRQVKRLQIGVKESGQVTFSVVPVRGYGGLASRSGIHWSQCQHEELRETQQQPSRSQAGILVLLFLTKSPPW